MQLKLPSLYTNKLAKTETESINSHVSPWLAAIAYPLGNYGLLPFYFSTIEVLGRENIPQSGSTIVAPTHRSRWDSLIVPHAVGYYASRRHLRFMVSANETEGLQGWFVRRLGGFPVDTEHPGIGSFRHAVELLVTGEMLTIFPEGNIFRDNEVHPLKAGLARIACHAQTKIGFDSQNSVKILPISIRYSHNIPKFRSHVKIDIGKPLEVLDFDVKKSVKAATESLTVGLETALKELDRQNAPLFGDRGRD